MLLKLSKCVIRSWSKEDAGSIARYANNRRIWENVRDIFPHPYSQADAMAFLSYVMQEQPETTFAIAVETEAIGAIGLRLGVDVHRKTAELGYWLGEPFWGKGITSEAVAAFTEHAFTTFNLVRIFAEPFAQNAASARVLEKAGFSCEGRLRAHVFKDGKILDALLYAKVVEPDQRV